MVGVRTAMARMDLHPVTNDGRVTPSIGIHVVWSRQDRRPSDIGKTTGYRSAGSDLPEAAFGLRRCRSRQSPPPC